MSSTAPVSESHAPLRRYWLAFVAVIVASFAVLGFTGVRIYQTAPPIPERVVATDGREVIGPGEISAGQNVWQAAGGMEMGSVWGHGSYVAPDWTADWLHRESLFILDRWAQAEYARPYDALGPEPQAALRARLHEHAKANRYDASTGTLTIDADRAEAFDLLSAHYADVFVARSTRSERAPSRTRSPPDASRRSSSGARGRPPPIARARTSRSPTTGPTSRSSATCRAAIPWSGPA